ncbi:MAG: hypothetical protein IPP48_12410 [Chitinophagaceae bacterium]|nr:hypothetical protein [Chitinophagaceae bacterium]
MKDNKSSVLVFLSSVLLLLLLVLMGFWGYDYFERRKASNVVLATPTKENTKKQAADESTRDTLPKR